ncbi:Uncharacterised protein [uncultured archaeon]|nr:Uncharacterised protein [uncultured archaeon]
MYGRPTRRLRQHSWERSNSMQRLGTGTISVDGSGAISVYPARYNLEIEGIMKIKGQSNAVFSCKQNTTPTATGLCLCFLQSPPRP